MSRAKGLIAGLAALLIVAALVALFGGFVWFVHLVDGASLAVIVFAVTVLMAARIVAGGMCRAADIHSVQGRQIWQSQVYRALVEAWCDWAESIAAVNGAKDGHMCFPSRFGSEASAVRGTGQEVGEPQIGEAVVRDLAAAERALAFVGSGPVLAAYARLHQHSISQDADSAPLLEALLRVMREDVGAGAYQDDRGLLSKLVLGDVAESSNQDEDRLAARPTG